MVERVVASRLLYHVNSHHLLPERQSAYRFFHSTETAIAAVHNDLVVASDANLVSAIVMLDLSSAFDTVDHKILLSLLQRRFGLDDRVLRWFTSYLHERSQKFLVNGHYSSNQPVTFSVPQGSVLGPLLFIMYTEDVTSILDRYSLHYHLFADDKQAYTSASPSAINGVRDRLHHCTTDIGCWCSSRRLQLNESKTELAWFGKRSHLAKLANSDCSVTVGANIIQPKTSVRNLGVLFDSELNLKKHVTTVTSMCFYQLRRLRQIRRLVGPDLTAQLVHAFILSRLDYGNSCLAGLPNSTITSLQRVQNAAARLIMNLTPFDHVSSTLKLLHWLPVHRRIKYKLCSLMHSIHVRQCPVYLSQLVQGYAVTQRRLGLRSGNSSDYRIPSGRSAFGECAFSFAGPSAWNTLPSTLKNITDRKVFLRQLKTFLFSA